MVYRPKTLTLVPKRDSSEMQGRVLHFKGGFDWFEAISANSRPQNFKNVLKMGSFGKTPGVNGLNSQILAGASSTELKTQNHVLQHTCN